MEYQMRFGSEAITKAEKTMAAGVAVADAMRQVNAAEETVMRCAEHLGRLLGDAQNAVLTGSVIPELFDPVPAASDMTRAITARRIAYGMLTLAAGAREAADLLEASPPMMKGT